MTDLTDVDTWQKALPLISVLVVEHWLSQTKLVESGSLIELAMVPFKMILNGVKQKELGMVPADVMEKDGKIGADGAYKISLTDQGVVRAEVSDVSGALKASLVIELDVVAEMEMGAAKLGNPLVAQGVAMLKKSLGR